MIGASAGVGRDFGGFGLAAGERGIGQGEVAGDLDRFMVALVRRGGTGLGGAAAEVIAVVVHGLSPSGDKRPLADTELLSEA